MEKTNCSVHERCIWELALEGAKRNAETAIHRMEKAESRLAAAEALLERAEGTLRHQDEFSNTHQWLSDLAKYREGK